MADESEVVSVMRMGWTEEEGDDVEIITIRRLAMIAIAWCVFSHRSLTEEKKIRIRDNNMMSSRGSVNTFL